jgi:hypothetical protein
MGVAGRFWRPDGGRYMELIADDFTRFVHSGYAKAAWNFQGAHRVAREYGPFNRDQNQMSRTRCSAGISNILEPGWPVLRPDAQSHS